MQRQDENDLIVDIDDVHQVVNIIMRHVKDVVGVKKLRITSERDFYWDFNQEDLCSFEGGAQPEAAVGSLRDDWDLLQSTLRDPENAVSLSLIHVAPLLRWIGETVGQ